MVHFMEEMTKSFPRASLCSSCSPALPVVHWIQPGVAEQLRPVHDNLDLERFEADTRQQQPVFQVELKVSDSAKPINSALLLKDISIRFGFNPTRITHQALHYLPGVDSTLAGSHARVSLTARIEPNHADSLALRLTPFRKSINSLPITAQPCPQPLFLGGLLLDSAQQRSVAFMKVREDRGESFMEQEIEEEIVHGLHLRLIGCAQRKVHCRGGLIADDVGYGKTVITLALIDVQRERDVAHFNERQTRQNSLALVPLNASLIIVPPHLVAQWQSEIRKFLGWDGAEVVVLHNVKDLDKCRMVQLKAAKIVIVSDRLFENLTYRIRLSFWGGASFTPTKPSRRVYEDWHSQCVEYIRKFQAGSWTYEDSDDRVEAKERLRADRKQRTDFIEGLRTAQVARSSRKGPMALPAIDEAANERETVVGGSKQSKDDGVVQQQKVFPQMEKQMSGDAHKVLEFFTWNRVVWDEVSYENPFTEQFVASIEAHSKWLLSGTPRLRNLRDVCSVARLLGLHVARPIDLRHGLPQVARGPSQEPRTMTETLCSYGKMKSDKFSEERHQQGESFLRAFSSSNKAIISSIQYTESVLVCDLDLAERLVYENRQKELHTASMSTGLLPQDIIRQVKDIVGHTNRSSGVEWLIYTASIKQEILHTAESEQVQVEAQVQQGHISEQLLATRKHVKLLFDRAVWLARRLMKCRKRDQDEDTTSELRQLLKSLQSGCVQDLGGSRRFRTLAEVLLPEQGQPTAGKLRQSTHSKHSNFIPGDAGENDLIFHAYKRSLHSWTDYFVLDSKTLDMLEVDDMQDLLLDLENAKNDQKRQLQIESMTRAQARSELQEIVHAFEQQIKKRKCRPEDQASQQELNEVSKQAAESKCRERGINTKGYKSKDDLKSLLLLDLQGRLDPTKYRTCNPAAMIPSECMPKLHCMKAVRSVSKSETREAFVSTFKAFTRATAHLDKVVSQEELASCLEIIEAQGEVPCHYDECQNPARVIVTQCGHAFCERHSSNKEYCGQDGDHCQSSLNCGIIMISSLLPKTRQLADEAGNLSVPEMSIGSSDYGSKFKAIIQLIKSFPSEDQVVIFTQYDKVLDRLVDALRSVGITCDTTSHKGKGRRCEKEPAEKSSSDTLREFQETKFRVLVQKLNSSEAAGSNLTNANRMIFATPLIVEQRADYEDFMRQARGRCIRRGQAKHVHIYYCVTSSTIEVNALQLRERKRIKLLQGHALGELVPLDAEPDVDGPGEHIQCSLSDHEVWKAMGETDYLAKVGIDD